MKLAGCYTAIVTPFLEEAGLSPSVDYDSLAQLVDWQIESGVAGLVVCGTSGEAATLSQEECLALVQFVVEKVAKRCSIIVGTGTNSTSKTIHLNNLVGKLGVDAVLVVSPYYSKPTQEGLESHFSAVADASAVPVILYDIPGRCSVEISDEVLVRLSAHSNIIGVKDATDSSTKVERLATSLDPNFSILSGSDHLVYPIIKSGGRGVISASSNVLPAEFVKLVDLSQSGSSEEAASLQESLQESIECLFAETNPSPAKAVLKLMGRIKADRMRLPLVPVRKDTREKIKKVFSLS